MKERIETALLIIIVCFVYGIHIGYTYSFTWERYEGETFVCIDDHRIGYCLGNQGNWTAYDCGPQGCAPENYTEADYYNEDLWECPPD